MNLFVLVLFFLLSASVFASYTKRNERLHEEDTLSLPTETDISFTESNAVPVELQFRACENNFRQKPRYDPEQGLSYFTCTVFSQDPIYLEEIVNLLTISLRLENLFFCKRSSNIGGKEATVLRAQRPFSLFSNPACLSGMYLLRLPLI